MFVHDGMLEPALHAVDYESVDSFRTERDTAFRSGWHCVATTFQLSDHGAFVATDVAGLPVLVRHEDGQGLHAFVNVCAHRHSLLESPGCGVRDSLRCRYHGWEYDLDGKLNKLPDGRSFRGLKVANIGLRTLPVATFGPFVYVSLDESGSSLADWLGPVQGELEPFYTRALRPAWVRVSEHDVNWKVIVENAVESYHVPVVHPETFRYYRAPELHDHRIEQTFTRYGDLEPWSSSGTGRAFERLAKLVLPSGDGRRFRHAHRFPNQLFYYGDLFCDLSIVVPLGPKRSRHVSYGFVPDALRFGRTFVPLMRMLAKTLELQGSKIFREDLSVWDGVQAGLAHAQTRGVLSAREERVWAFQRWVAEQTGRAHTAGLVTLQSPHESAGARTKER